MCGCLADTQEEFGSTWPMPAPDGSYISGDPLPAVKGGLSLHLKPELPAACWEVTFWAVTWKNGQVPHPPWKRLLLEGGAML